MLEFQKTKPDVEPEAQEFALDRLLASFQQSVLEVSGSSEKQQQMLGLLTAFNPDFIQVAVGAKTKEAWVLSQVVAGIYAPLIHGFSNMVLENIRQGTLTSNIVAPPRDVVPLVVSLKVLSRKKGISVNLMLPPVNRNTVGVFNNQKANFIGQSKYFPRLMDQVASNVNGDFRVCEIETGIYGTTSLVMGSALKFRGIADFVSLKFFGKGPMLSYLHAVQSEGREWVAEEAESRGFVDAEQSSRLMVLVDSLEEIGMQNVYQSVESLKVSREGKIVPVIVPVTKREQQISWAANMAVKATAAKYQDMDAVRVGNLLSRLPWLIEMSSKGFPFTLTAAIPPMDSKKKHYESIKNSGVFSYPDLVI